MWLYEGPSRDPLVPSKSSYPQRVLRLRSALLRMQSPCVGYACKRGQAFAIACPQYDAPAVVETSYKVKYENLLSRYTSLITRSEGPSFVSRSNSSWLTQIRYLNKSPDLRIIDWWSISSLQALRSKHEHTTRTRLVHVKVRLVYKLHKSERGPAGK